MPNELQSFARWAVRSLIESTRQPKPVKVASPHSENWYRDKLSASLGGKTEVATPDGRIDILTSKEVIEVKRSKEWKHALGQVLAYSKHYPAHQKRVHLFGELSIEDLTAIQGSCYEHGVRVTWEK